MDKQIAKSARRGRNDARNGAPRSKMLRMGSVSANPLTPTISKNCRTLICHVKRNTSREKHTPSGVAARRGTARYCEFEAGGLSAPGRRNARRSITLNSFATPPKPAATADATALPEPASRYPKTVAEVPCMAVDVSRCVPRLQVRADALVDALEARYSRGSA